MQAPPGRGFCPAGNLRRGLPLFLLLLVDVEEARDIVAPFLFLFEERIGHRVIAFGLDPVLESKQGMRLVLTSDLSDPQSVANQLSQSYRSLAAALEKPPGTGLVY